MRNILVISYANLNYNGRTKELINVCEKLGTTYVIVGKKESKDNEKYHEVIMNGKNKYRDMYRTASDIIEKYNINVLLVDNRQACVVGNLLKMKYRQLFVIQDVREMYFFSVKRSIQSNLGCLIEYMMMRTADAVICCNKYRANIMKEKYRLKKQPLVFENRWKLPVEICEEKYIEKYSWLTKLGIPIVLSTYGCVVDRTNDKLVKDFKKVEDRAALVMIGGQPQKDLEVVNALIEKNDIKNVYILDRVQHDELQYVISISSIGVVNYGTYDDNNLYCASGKIYEFLYAGKPVITTLNPPLKDFCDMYGVGEYSDDYSESITKVLDNYNYYEEKVKLASDKISVEENEVSLYKELNKAIPSW